eukprot:TRINITY_DN2248_c0_g1_i3.p1 TRINITY_DN2248_c0_g1~~TRINITY_DN2248_c0_g1_i3.p1  ORF type:complete len:163 (-),score=16.51 TRINITY_DN2248_c0_g1_i3:40-528(-)
MQCRLCKLLFHFQAGHGKEAIEKILFKSTQECCTGYNVVLMDVNMPIMNGIEATKEINNKISTGILPRTPIVALTGTELSESEQDAFLKEIGFSEYQIKPFSKIKLENLLKRYGIRQCYIGLSCFLKKKKKTKKKHIQNKVNTLNQKKKTKTQNQQKNTQNQ